MITFAILANIYSVHLPFVSFQLEPKKTLNEERASWWWCWESPTDDDDDDGDDGGGADERPYARGLTPWRDTPKSAAH